MGISAKHAGKYNGFSFKKKGGEKTQAEGVGGGVGDVQDKLFHHVIFTRYVTFHSSIVLVNTICTDSMSGFLCS